MYTIYIYICILCIYIYIYIVYGVFSSPMAFLHHFFKKTTSPERLVVTFLSLRCQSPPDLHRRSPRGLGCIYGIVVCLGAPINLSPAATGSKEVDDRCATDVLPSGSD